MKEELFDLAKTYLFDLVLKNEEVKRFSKDFVSASMHWIRSWFLVDDPVTNSIVESDKPVAVKEAVLEAKLSELSKNPQFVKELQAQLATYETHRSRLKNVTDNVQIKAEGTVHIGDKGAVDTGQYDQKNVVKGGSITAGKDFRLGDDAS